MGKFIIGLLEKLTGIDVELLQSENDHLQNENVKLSIQLEETDQQLCNAKRKIEQLQSRCDEFDPEKQQEEVELLKKEVFGTKEKELEDRARNLDGREQSLNEKEMELQKNCQNQEKALQEAERRMQELQQQLAELKLTQEETGDSILDAVPVEHSDVPAEYSDSSDDGNDEMPVPEEACVTADELSQPLDGAAEPNAHHLETSITPPDETATEVTGTPQITNELTGNDDETSADIPATAETSEEESFPETKEEKDCEEDTTQTDGDTEGRVPEDADHDITASPVNEELTLQENTETVEFNLISEDHILPEDGTEEKQDNASDEHVQSEEADEEDTEASGIPDTDTGDIPVVEIEIPPFIEDEDEDHLQKEEVDRIVADAQTATGTDHAMQSGEIQEEESLDVKENHDTISPADESTSEPSPTPDSEDRSTDSADSATPAQEPASETSATTPPKEPVTATSVSVGRGKEADSQTSEPLTVDNFNDLKTGFPYIRVTLNTYTQYLFDTTEVDVIVGLFETGINGRELITDKTVYIDNNSILRLEGLSTPFSSDEIQCDFSNEETSEQAAQILLTAICTGQPLYATYDDKNGRITERNMYHICFKPKEKRFTLPYKNLYADLFNEEQELDTDNIAAMTQKQAEPKVFSVSHILTLRPYDAFVSTPQGIKVIKEGIKIAKKNEQKDFARLIKTEILKKVPMMPQKMLGR